MVMLGKLAFRVFERLVVGTMPLSNVNENLPLQVDILLIYIRIGLDSPELQSLGYILRKDRAHSTLSRLLQPQTCVERRKCPAH